MSKNGAMTAVGTACLAALALVLTPALAATSQKSKQQQRSRSSTSLGSGLIRSFTPAVADPRLAAEFARRGFQSGSFRFTPSSASPDESKAVRVAVRARTATPTATRTAAATSAAAVTAITPAAYDLGVAVGWRRFALTGDVERVRNGALPGERRAAEVGVSYSGKKFAGRVRVGAEEAEGAQRLVAADVGYSLDVGGSYSIARNVAVTGGVRYKIQRDRLQPLVDERRDSQSVYIGTAFRF